MDLGIDGRVALVIGGGRGIGYAVCNDLAAAGCKVAIADINGDGAKESAGNLAAETSAETMGIGLDISSLESVKSGYDEVTKKFGAPEILIITAAIVDDKLFLESSIDDWKPMIDICLYGPMNVLSVALPSMVENKYGRVVCMATDSARVGQARLSYYAAAKAGVVALVKSVAQEVGSKGVNLNVVSPGATNTELRMAREEAMKAEMGEEKYARRVEKVLRMYPVRRIGEPEDIASITAFLVSERASWITGQVVSVNGGFVMP
ncbi:MAG: SDR family oxidoreductase [Rhodospirillales bacterium]|nr:SDR family oxidoreductase [Rhodospirillales bacterium]